MKLRILLAGSIFAGLALGAASADAATGTPAFRVPLNASSSAGTGSPIWAWMQSVSQCSSTCGSGTRSTSYVCQNVSDYDYSGGGYGAPEADASCVAGGAGAKPATDNASCTDYSGCSYSWVKPATVTTPVVGSGVAVGTATCGWVHSVYSPYCQRSDGTIMSSSDYKFCQSSSGYNVNPSVPDTLGYDRTTEVTSGCTNADDGWVVGTWGIDSSTCSVADTQIRTVVCTRKYNGKAMADSFCSAAKPSTVQINPNYSTCSYSWQSGAWGASANTCATSTTQARTVTCMRSNDGGTATTDADCASHGAGAKPASSQTVSDYSTCTYAWTPTAWSASSNSCSASATQTRSVTCTRSNGDTVPNASCAGAPPATTQTIADYSGCSYAWQTGGWSAWSSGCSASATQTRSVTCYRSDGTAVGDASCGATAKPAPTQTGPNYASCGYSFSVGGWGASSSTCSASATQTRSVQCYRSDGTAMPDSSCNAAGVGTPARSQVVADYSTCGGFWSVGGWSDWSSHCSASAIQTRAVTCIQNGTGTAQSDAFCNSTGAGATPTRTNGPAAVYDGCTYYGGPWWGNYRWSSTCSATAQRSDDRTCYRSDGTAMSTADPCLAAGVPVTETVTVANYSGCGYTWQVGGWSDWNSHCSPSAVQTRAVWCQRSDGATVASGCAGAAPASTNGPTAVYDQCGGFWSIGGWSDWNSHCSANAVQTRGVQCYQNGTGAAEPDSFCNNTGAGGTPARSQSGAVYDACGYAAVNWGGWSSCSGNTSVQTAQCQRSDGAIVDPSNCTARGISVTNSQSCFQNAGSGNCVGGSIRWTVPFNGTVIQNWSSDCGSPGNPGPCQTLSAGWMQTCLAEGGICYQSRFQPGRKTDPDYQTGTCYR